MTHCRVPAKLAWHVPDEGFKGDFFALVQTSNVANDVGLTRKCKSGGNRLVSALVIRQTFQR
jgi:hypothetical protein